MVQTLVIQVMPFDHPNHAVVSRRALRLKDPFNEYSLQRLKHRLFRLLRTFSKHATSDGQALILDDRLRTKAYGKEVAKYLLAFGRGAKAAAPMTQAAPVAEAPAPKKKATKKKSPDKPDAPQLSLL
jgi:hypothetical protein